MSIDISRVARAVCDLSIGSNVPLKLSHAQQCVAAAFGFNSLAAYQAARKLETAVDDSGAFVIINSDLLLKRSRELVESSDEAELATIVREAIKKLYPYASIHSALKLRRVTAASAIARLVGLDPISVDDLDDARCQIIENKRGEVQGFLFNFDEPEWERLNAHIRQRHGSLLVYAPASFLRIVEGCEVPKRFYLHGDQREDQPHEFFCRACDLFVDAAHFESGEHSDHGKRYFDALNMWNRGVARWKLPLRRPSSAPNILAAKADEDRKSADAARSDFHRWIEKQVERDDVVGDIAKDIMRDEKFPRYARLRQEVVNYIKGATAWDGPIAAIEQAWHEFVGSGRSAESLAALTWPAGPDAINAIAMPPDHRAMLVPQLTILEMPGRVLWRFSADDDFESSSTGHLSTLEKALESAGADLTNVEWVDITYHGVVRGACHGWELQPYAAKIASDLRAGTAPLKS